MALHELQSVLSGEGYRLCDSRDISRRTQFANFEPIFRSGIDYILQALLSGGIVFTDKSGVTEIKESYMKETYSSWDAWLRLTFVHWLTVGWSACVTERNAIQWMRRVGKLKNKQKQITYSSSSSSQEEDDNVAENMNVRVLEIDSVDVWVKKDIFGEVTMRFFDRATVKQLSGVASEWKDTELTNVYVSIVNPPSLDSRGNIQFNSIFNRIIEAWEIHNQNVLCHKQSSVIMTNPPILLENVPVKSDVDDAHAAGLTLGLLGNGKGCIGESSTAVRPINRTFRERAERDFFQDDEEQDYTPGVITTSASSETQVVELGPEKVLTKQNMPVAAPHLIEWSHKYMYIVFNSLGLPLGVQLNINPYLDKGAAVGKSTGGRENVSSDTTANEIYSQTIRDWKRRITNHAQNIVNEMTRTLRYDLADALIGDIEETTKTQKKNKKRSRSSEKTPKLDRDQLSDEYTILWSIPCIPSDHVATELYRMGIMRYDAFKSIKCSRWDINPNALESKCKLTLQEMNGINISEEKEQTASELGTKLAAFKGKKKS